MQLILPNISTSWLDSTEEPNGSEPTTKRISGRSFSKSLIKSGNPFTLSKF